MEPGDEASPTPCLPEVFVVKVMDKLGGLENLVEMPVTVATYVVRGNRSGVSISAVVAGTEIMMETFCACELSTGLRIRL